MTPNRPENQTGTLLMLLTVTLFFFAFVGLAYVTHQHPSPGTPLMVGMGGVTLMVAVFAFARVSR
ncbi:hypothetical protein [Streptomyces niveus]